jgi:tetrahydromethanopterin S-methyltransferase subunit G
MGARSKAVQVDEQSAKTYGRVDEQGNVYVRTGTGERMVGRYPGSDPDEALAFFTRKYDDFDAEVRILEQRVRGGAPAKSLQHSLRQLRERLPELAAVGDLDALQRRLDALTAKVDTVKVQQTQRDEAALAEAVAARTAIVEEMEALAAKPAASVRWKDNLDRAIFARWQEHQKTGPRLPKATADALWKRLRDARKTVEANRREFFSHQDELHRSARSRKQQIVTEAQRLAERREPAIREYQALLGEWKAAGRAGSKADDELWAQFKAAGDAIFAKKHEQDAVVRSEERENLVKKQALLAEAEALLPITDLRPARSALRRIEEQWDAIGHVPHDQVRAVEQRLQTVEDAVRQVEQQRWEQTASPQQERAADLAGQLQASITELEAKAEAARAAGDEKAAAGFEAEAATKRTWLAVVAK